MYEQSNWSVNITGQYSPVKRTGFFLSIIVYATIAKGARDLNSYLTTYSYIHNVNYFICGFTFTANCAPFAIIQHLGMLGLTCEAGCRTLHVSVYSKVHFAQVV